MASWRGASSRHWASRRVRSDAGPRGRLHRIHRGVYAVGHPVLTVDGRRMAAVLAAGPGAVLSHASAAALWEIRPQRGSHAHRRHVRSAGGRAKRRGPRLHRAPTLVR